MPHTYKLKNTVAETPKYRRRGLIQVSETRKIVFPQQGPSPAVPWPEELVKQDCPVVIISPPSAAFTSQEGRQLRGFRSVGSWNWYLSTPVPFPRVPSLLRNNYHISADSIKIACRPSPWISPAVWIAKLLSNSQMFWSKDSLLVFFLSCANFFFYLTHFFFNIILFLFLYCSKMLSFPLFLPPQS